MSTVRSGLRDADADAALRECERVLFAHYELAPSVRTVELDDPHVRVRLLEFGADAAAPPVLLLHGTFLNAP